MTKRKWVVLGVALAVVIGIAAASIRIIQPSTIGVVVTLGKESGQIESGVHLVVPFVSNVYEYDLRIQQITENLQAYSKDTQTVSYSLSVQYTLDSANITNIYRTMGTTYQSRITPLISESSKSAFAKYTADEIVSRRNELSQEIMDKTKEMLSPYHITISEIALADIDFSDDYEAAIERKQIASQDVLTEKHLLEKIQIQGQQSIAKAKADAEVQRLKEETLTDKILQQQALDKWDGKLPYYFGGGTLPFISISQNPTSAPSNSVALTPTPTPTPKATEQPEISPGG